MTNMKTLLAGAAIALCMAGSAAANIVDVTGDPTFAAFPRIGGTAGTYGLEVRGGRDGARDWEIGVGQGTSSLGNFSQGEFAWTTDQLVSFFYDYGVAEANKASVTIGGTTVSYDFGTLKLGNTIEIFAKRDARLKLTNIDGHAVDIDVDNSS
jgi:hypothetical protein